mgnify:FL=1
MKSLYKSNGLWFFGLSGSGKSYASKFLNKLIKNPFLIDGDDIRKNISFDLNYSIKDRKTQVKRVYGLAKISINQGFFPIISTVYFDKKILKDLEKNKIKLVEIKRNNSMVNSKIKNNKNVIGKDIFQENINCERILNDDSFKKKLKELVK